MNESCHTYEWVISHIWMGHVTHINDSSHTYEWVTFQLWIRFSATLLPPIHDRWVTLHIWMGHVTHMSVSCRTYEWITSHTYMSHITRTNESRLNCGCTFQPPSSRQYMTGESRHTHAWVTSHIWMSHVKHSNVSRHTHKWVMSHIWMSHVSPVDVLPNHPPPTPPRRLPHTLHIDTLQVRSSKS